MDTSGIHKQVHQIYDPQFQRIKDNHLIAGYMKFSPDGNVLAEHNHSFDGKNISFLSDYINSILVPVIFITH